MTNACHIKKIFLILLIVAMLKQMSYNKNMKILAPAGNFDSLKSAIFAGADEVYLGVNDFNARNNVNCFKLEELEKAVDFAHLYGVKAFLTLNVLFSNEELESAAKLAVYAYSVGIDAVIIQDVGLAEILSKNYPEIPLHASTQMGIHNLEGVNFLKPFNFKRVVLARETSLSEIKRIKENSDIEIEYFVHGALCVSFSGNCYLSSYLFNASGNRGRCKQLCRLKYSLLKDNKKIKSAYLLSPKDFCLIDRLLDLVKAGVTSLKIEGRARRPYYVYATTLAYKNALKGLTVDKNSLSLAFNRGFSEGYLDGNSNIISKFNNHTGVKIGKVTALNRGKNFDEVFIKSSCPITKKSVLKFYRNGEETSSLSAHDVTELKKGLYKITGKLVGIKIDDSVHLLADGKKEEEIKELNKKVNVPIKIFAFKNTPLRAEFYVNGKREEFLGDTLSPAKTQAISVEELKACFSKSERISANLEIKTDGNSFIVKSALNKFRRELIDKIECAILSPFKRKIALKNLNFETSENYFSDFEFTDSLSFSKSSKNVIYSPETYSIEKINEFIKITKKNGQVPYLDTPNFATKKDIELLREIISKTGIKIIANNPYALSLTNDYIAGGGLNVYNSITAKRFNSPFIRAEGENKVKAYYMSLRHCPFKEHLKAKCTDCPYEKGYEYISEGGTKLKLKRKKLSSCTFYLTD